MNEMLATLADISRLALGHLTLNVVAMDPNDVVRDAIEQLTPHMARRIWVSLPTTPAHGEWDPVMLDRVITNLVSNALKYSPDDSPIDVAVRTDSDWVHLTVRDCGIGLDPQDLAWLFRRYGGGREATDRGIHGLSLGLYLSHYIVEPHAGRLWAESEGLGLGTTMHLDLPWAVPTHPDGPAVRPLRPTPLGDPLGHFAIASLSILASPRLVSTPPPTRAGHGADTTIE